MFFNGYDYIRNNQLIGNFTKGVKYLCKPNGFLYEMVGDLANGFQIEVYNSFD